MLSKPSSRPVGASSSSAQSKLNGNYQSSYVLVVDALDERDDENNIWTILDILAEVRLLETVRLRILITSRREVPIRHDFCDIPEAEHENFALHNISPAIVDHDISIFLEYNLTYCAVWRPTILRG
jgi:hypothetical protein